MNTFLLRRLAPFFAMALVLKALSFCLLLLAMRELVDWSFMPMIKTIGVLFKTTVISFLYLMLPYVLYLTLLPGRFVNGKTDRIISTAAYAFFIFANLFEETMSMVFWNKFSSTFNFIAVEYLVDMREIANDITQNYLFVAYILALAIITFLIVRRSGKFLLTDTPSPCWPKRLLYALIYISFCSLVCVNHNEKELEIKENYFNNELAKDGTYSLARSLIKSKRFPPLRD